jgi:hypothetical protein
MRYTLLASLCWQRQREITDNLVELLIHIARRVGVRAERVFEKSASTLRERASARTSMKLFKHPLNAFFRMAFLIGESDAPLHRPQSGRIAPASNSRCRPTGSATRMRRTLSTAARAHSSGADHPRTCQHHHSRPLSASPTQRQLEAGTEPYRFRIGASTSPRGQGSPRR